VQQALRAAGAVRPIDPAEAAKGRLDVATVKDWGSGDPGALGDLKVTKMSTTFDAAADLPLSVQLARLLEQLEVGAGFLGGGGEGVSREGGRRDDGGGTKQRDCCTHSSTY
jgi:hypothetical protein